MSEPLTFEKNQRMWDLLRYYRSDLLTAKLITFDEFDALAQDHPAVKRLEDYDVIRQRFDNEVAAHKLAHEQWTSAVSELEVLRNDLDNVEQHVEDLKRQLAETQAACAVKDSALEKYGQHKDGCLWATELPTGNGQFWGCDCGLDDAINEPNPGARANQS